MSKTTIPQKVKAELWWRAAGRCEFKGCNKPLYLHGITMDNCNLSNCAHIIGDSENGPRGTKDSKILAQNFNNIMLMCPECHHYVDHEGVGEYDAQTLFDMKKKHEKRMEYLTGFKEDLQANIVTYCANIAEHMPQFAFPELQKALLPDFYPTSTDMIQLGVNFYAGEDWDGYWKREEENLVHFCKSRVLDCIDRWEYKRIALFGLAPMPLLVRLGTMLNNKHNVVVYQKQRSGGWKWPKTDDTIDYIIHKPRKVDGVPVLVLSLSFSIIERVKKENAGASIWEITINNPNPDFLQSEKMLYDFGRKIEMILDEISKTSSHQAINLYLAAPTACCIEFGRVWMQKANSPIKIFDYDIKFSKTDKLAITIKNKEND